MNKNEINLSNNEIAGEDISSAHAENIMIDKGAEADASQPLKAEEETMKEYIGPAEGGAFASEPEAAESEADGCADKTSDDFEFLDSSVPDALDAADQIHDIIWEDLENNKPICRKAAPTESEEEIKAISFAAPDGVVEADAEISEEIKAQLKEARRMALLSQREMVLLPIPDLVMFPNCVLPISIESEASIKAIEYALENDALLFLVTKRRASSTGTAKNTLYSVGCVCAPVQAMRFSGGVFHLAVAGIARAGIVKIIQHRPFGKVKVKPLPDQTEDKHSEELYARYLLNQLKEISKFSLRLDRELRLLANDTLNPSKLADTVAFNLDFTVKEKQAVLEAVSVNARLKKVSALVALLSETMALDMKITKKAEAEMNKSQKEYVLRQHIKALYEELGEGVNEDEDIDRFREAILASGMPEDTAKHAMHELSRLRRISSASPDYDVVYNYIDRLLQFPWNKSTEDCLDIRKAAEILEAEHYGLKDVKERILEFLAVRKLKADHHGPILCLVGPPGVGKTSLGRSIAKAMGRKFYRSSLGGVRDEAEIRGHRRTYVGAMPGRIIQAFCSVGSKNPVIMLDEIDKVGKDYRGDPSDALLEALDPEQNCEFKDNYYGMPVDLSGATFIMTANVLDTIPNALRDRMEVIRIASYTTEEKLEIGKRFLVGRQREVNGLTEKQFKLSDGALRCLIREYTREAGVRGLERKIAELCRKVARKITEAKRELRRFNVLQPKDVRELLGAPPYKDENKIETNPCPGTVQGLSWTQVGGETLNIESAVMPGRGKIVLTGHLGKVMQESARTAITWGRSFCSERDIDFKYYQSDIHIHVPEGATPKDGPSAGVAIACSFISSITGKAARQDIAMTGEITLTGKVKAIGGVREKATAAFNAGIYEIIMPEENRSNIEDIPEQVRDHLQFHFIDKAEEAFKLVVGYYDKA